MLDNESAMKIVEQMKNMSVEDILAESKDIMVKLSTVPDKMFVDHRKKRIDLDLTLETMGKVQSIRHANRNHHKAKYSALNNHNTNLVLDKAIKLLNDSPSKQSKCMIPPKQIRLHSQSSLIECDKIGALFTAIKSKSVSDSDVQTVPEPTKILTDAGTMVDATSKNEIGVMFGKTLGERKNIEEVFNRLAECRSRDEILRCLRAKRRNARMRNANDNKWYKMTEQGRFAKYGQGKVFQQ
ncbi:hypothetical protein ACOME3_007786 [Neoechinorhynchus agilis]